MGYHLKDLIECLYIILGLYVLLPKVRRVISYVRKLLAIRKQGSNIKAKFGKNKAPWAVITGCTAGIGEQIVYRLAHEGFNLVLISRNLEKLKIVEKEARIKNQIIDTKVIKADLCNQALDLAMYQIIAAEIGELDIAILVNNAGVICYGYFKDIEANE